jgi:hypothetical protein
MVSTSGRAIIAAPFLATGAGLLVFILSGVSLPLSAAAVGAAGVLLATRAWRGKDEPGRNHIRRRIQAGIVAGILATIAYDLSRALLVRYAGFDFRPFASFRHFGQALLGTEETGPWVTLAGTTFHVINGVGFAVAYAICLGHRGIIAGIAWALLLELMMVSLYPGWLDIRAIDEFLQVSVLGHLAYGSVLGFVSRRVLDRQEDLP